MAETNYIPLSTHYSNQKDPIEEPGLTVTDVPSIGQAQNNFLKFPGKKHQTPRFRRPLIGMRRRKCTNTILIILGFIWEKAFLHISAVAFLIFCYVCAFRPIQLGKVSEQEQRISIIKSGVTTLSILYVSLTLIPLYSLISDLKSEEFFRALAVRKRGVPLASVNKVATPSNSLRSTIVALFSRHTSNYYIYALIASVLALATSSLAPACLAVNEMEVDGELVALEVGALQRGNLWSLSDSGPQPTIQALTKSLNLGPISWAEYALNANFSFQQPDTLVKESHHLVPLPINMPVSRKARWISDVVSMKPTCEWLQTTEDEEISLPSALDSGLLDGPKPYNGSLQVTWNITEQGLQVQMPISDISLQESFSNANDSDTSFSSPNAHTPPFHLANVRPGWFSNDFASNAPSLSTSILGTSRGLFTKALNLTTMEELTNGATLFQLRTCVSKCEEPEKSDIQDSGGLIANVTFNNPEIKHAVYKGTDGAAVDVAFLYCNPNAQIETRIVSNDQGSLSIGPSVKTTQKNLDPLMTQQFLSFAMNNIDIAGPPTPPTMEKLGYQLLIRLVFGDVAANQTIYTPQSLKNITEGYTRLLQSATNFFLDGSMSTSFVPARMNEAVLVLTASKPHLYASTVLYMALAIFLTFCQFRQRVPHFSFYAVAASLHRSEVPDVYGRHKDLGGPMGPSQELENARLVWDGEQIRLRPEFRSDTSQP